MIGRHAGQIAALLRGGRRIVGGECQRGQRFHGHGRIGLQFKQHLGVALHGLPVLLIEENRNQVGKGVGILGVARQGLPVHLHGGCAASGLLQRGGFGEQSLFAVGKQKQVFLERLQCILRVAGVQ